MKKSTLFITLFINCCALHATNNLLPIGKPGDATLCLAKLTELICDSISTNQVSAQPMSIVDMFPTVDQQSKLTVKDEGKFKVFNQIRYNKTPTTLSSDFGLTPISVPAQFLMIEQTAPYNTLFLEVVKYAKEKVNEEFVCLDIEMWPYAVADIANTQQKFLNVLDTTRKYNSYSKLGYYNVPNKPAYKWSSIQPVGSTNYLNWQSQNTSLSQLYKAVDFLAPSFYAYDNDTLSWRKFVDANLSEIKRLNKNNRPVYAYIWPQYHGNSDPWSLQWIDQVSWNFQLETLYKLVDGIIIWTSNKDPQGNTIYFDATMPWWITTQNFMKRHGLTTSEPSVHNQSVEMALFPNPCNRQFQLQCESEMTQVTILNLNGQTVYQQALNSNQETIQFNKLGLYLVVLKTKTGNSVQRLVVQ